MRVIIDPKVLENVLGGGDPRDSHGLESLSASLLSGGLQRKLRTISLESFRALLSYLKVSQPSFMLVATHPDVELNHGIFRSSLML